jgi:acetyltransferase-like isoleucine patch superfamily enzyme
MSSFRTKAFRLSWLIDGTIRAWLLRARSTHIGKGTTIGRGTIIRDGVEIGKNCYIGDLCVFEGQTIVGEGTCINAQCHITRFSRIGSHVFIAPFFLSTNDNKMTYHRKGHGTNLVGVVIEDEVRIAGHVMTLPGIRIGKGAIVGSYSLVTRDVEPYTLVYGIPAVRHVDKNDLLKEQIDLRFKKE